MANMTYKILENYRPDAKNYPPVGRAMYLTDGKYEVIVTLDVGIRIMYFSLVGRPNMFDDDCALIEICPTAGPGTPTAANGCGMLRRRFPAVTPLTISPWKSTN